MIGRAAAVGLVAAAAINLVVEPPAGAAWGVLLALSGTRHGSSASTNLVAPTGAKATCTSLVSLTVHVAWNAVTHASTYRVWRSTSKTTGYSVVASGVTATSWTSSGLSAGTFYFEVSATTGTHWAGPNSVASNSITIALACVPPTL
ncbi:MAG TPA: hypothetical protein VIJ60_10365 [Acidimicrobiales bacterium]